MATSHLGHNWYLFELTEPLCKWIMSCLLEHIDIVQPFDTIQLRAKKNLDGRKYFKLVFSASYINNEQEPRDATESPIQSASHMGRKYRMPVCYLLDINTGKFKGNKMHYCIDSNGTHYSDKFPVYSDRFKFAQSSRYNLEKKALWSYLNELYVPDAAPSSKERRVARKKKAKGRAHATGAYISHHGRKKKKPSLMRGIQVI